MGPHGTGRGRQRDRRAHGDIAGETVERTVTEEHRRPHRDRGRRDGRAHRDGGPAPRHRLASGADGSALNDEGFRLLQAGDVEGALPVLESAVAALAGSSTIAEAYASYNLATARFALGRCDGVGELLDRLERCRASARRSTSSGRRSRRPAATDGGGSRRRSNGGGPARAFGSPYQRVRLAVARQRPLPARLWRHVCGASALATPQTSPGGLRAAVASPSLVLFLAFVASQGGRARPVADPERRRGRLRGLGGRGSCGSSPRRSPSWPRSPPGACSPGSRRARCSAPGARSSRSACSRAQPRLVRAARARAGADVGRSRPCSPQASPRPRPGPSRGRTKVVARAFAGPPTAWILGMPVIGVVAEVHWRLAFLAFPPRRAAGHARRRRQAATCRSAQRRRPPGLLRRADARRWALGELLGELGLAGTLVFSGGAAQGVRHVDDRDRVALAAVAVAYLVGNQRAGGTPAERSCRTMLATSIGAAVVVALMWSLTPAVALTLVLFAISGAMVATRTVAGTVYGFTVAGDLGREVGTVRGHHAARVPDRRAGRRSGPRPRRLRPPGSRVRRAVPRLDRALRVPSHGAATGGAGGGSARGEGRLDAHARRPGEARARDPRPAAGERRRRDRDGGLRAPRRALATDALQRPQAGLDGELEHLAVDGTPARARRVPRGRRPAGRDRPPRPRGLQRGDRLRGGRRAPAARHRLGAHGRAARRRAGRGDHRDHRPRRERQRRGRQPPTPSSTASRSATRSELDIRAALA